MDGKKLALYLVLISSIILVLSQTPRFQAIGMGQHEFVSGRNVDCVSCHRYDAYQDMNSSQKEVLDAHKEAAGNKNYTTYLEVGGISYDPVAMKIYTSVDSDGNGTNDVWTWNGSVWIYNNTAKLYDLDLNGDGNIAEAELCKLCHSLELMGVSTTVSEVHTVGIRFCDDDRCHGNAANQYNAYLLFKGIKSNVTEAGKIISNNSVHGGYYNNAANIDSNKTIFFHSYGQVPGNAAPGDNENISTSPYTCIGCHSHVNVTGSIPPAAVFNHTNTTSKKMRYT